MEGPEPGTFKVPPSGLGNLLAVAPEEELKEVSQLNRHFSILAF